MSKLVHIAEIVDAVIKQNEPWDAHDGFIIQSKQMSNLIYAVNGLNSKEMASDVAKLAVMYGRERGSTV